MKTNENNVTNREIRDELLDMVSGGQYDFEEFSEEELGDMLDAINRLMNKRLIDFKEASALMNLVFMGESTPEEVISACNKCSTSRSAIDELLNV